MNVSLLIFLVSAFLLLFFIVLLRMEERRGRRLLLGGARGWLDQKVLALNYFFSHISISWGSGALRVTFHFLMHEVLGGIVSALRALEYKVTHLQRQNRNIVKSFSAQKEKGHLHLIAEHKQNTALSEDQKKELKVKAIEPN